MFSLKGLFQKQKGHRQLSGSVGNLSFFQKYLSAVLVFILFLSQTIHVSFFDRVSANVDDYRDIVSLIVDEDTYSTLRVKIQRYANDIQGYLKATRVTIFVTPDGADPAVIAAHNEKLYYEGDGKAGISTLVGTILVGNVPIPIVHKEGASVPSLYPYTDFDDKRFVYDPKERKYLYTREAPEASDVDIWHGVINPAIGKAWDDATDISEVEEFLDKTHEFYTKSGKFAPSTLPPRVFYYDGFNESASVALTDLYKYVLFTQNVENVIYKRWSKYLLNDITQALSQFQQANKGPEDDYAATIPGLAGETIGDESLDPAMVAGLPDIQTARPIATFLKKFYEIINTKTLSDSQKAVFNAGRYNSGTTVRVDQGAIAMTLTDDLAMQILQGTNTAIEGAIDKALTDNKYARPIIILDGVYQKSPFIPIDTLNGNRSALPFVEYKNYFFGRPASTITDPSQCTIARGSSGATSAFGRSILVEANAGFDVNTTQSHVASLSGDTADLIALHKNAAYACFTAAGVPKIQSYYGGNSLLRISGTTTDPNDLFRNPPSGTNFTNFSLPIFSLGGMKETTRLPNPSINDCLSSTYQYTLLQPHIYSYNINDSWSYAGGTYVCEGAYPDEWNTGGGYCTKNKATNNPRFTCLTNHNYGPSGVSLKGAMSDYASTSCAYGTITINGQYYNGGSGLGGGPTNFGSQCITYGDPYAGTPDIDTTIYKNYAYHTIPSLYRHISPTSAELTAAENNGATPSLAIDIVRSVEFLTPRGGRAKLTYPNFFEAPTTDIAAVRAWLKNIAITEWNTIIAQEGTLPYSGQDAQINTALSVNALPAAPIDWNTFISDAAIEKIIQAKRWLSPDVTKKYNSIVETSLSYSRTDPSDLLSNPPKLPENPVGYDIAYLGLAPFIPGGGQDSSADSEEIQEYQYNLGEIQGANFAEDRDTGLDNPLTKATAQCGPPDGVPLFQWPQAIACWLQSLLPPKIVGGSCGGNTIGLSSSSSPSVSPPLTMVSDSPALQGYYSAGKLVYEVARTSLEPYGTLDLKFYFDRAGTRVMPSSSSKVILEVLSINSGGTLVPSSEYPSFIDLSSDNVPYTDAGAGFLVSAFGKLANVTLRAKLIISLPDGNDVNILSDPLIIRITDEFIEVTPLRDGIPVADIDTTDTSPVEISLIPKKGSAGTEMSPFIPYTIDIYDDVTNTLISSGNITNTGVYIFPQTYRDTIGVYRIVARDGVGRFGESTLAVRSGPLALLDFTPVSSVIAKGSSSLGVLRLLDVKGNPISPTLHSLKITAEGGYLLDERGLEVTSLSLDTVESEMIISYGKTDIGDMKLRFEIQDPMVSIVETISVIDTPKIKVIRTAVPQVGGSSIDMQIEVLDALTGNPITGFSSIVSLDIPEGAGTFSGTEFPIVDGRTEAFVFTPGKIAGDHLLSISIPGIGNTSERKFNILPGLPMYVDGTIADTSIDFTLRDRYGNVSDESLAGTIKKNQDTPTGIFFTSGRASILRSSGYWRVEVPTLLSNTITYTDSESTQTATGVSVVSTPKTIKGIPYFSLYVPDIASSFDFLPDYSARYTVLAGGSFLSEGKQILYDTDPGKSQSLAVSTLLESPYTRDTFFSLFPGGGWSLGEAIDIALESTLSLRGTSARLEIMDRASQSSLAQVVYPLSGLPFSSCTEESPDSNTCPLTTEKNGGVVFALFEDSEYTLSIGATSMSILDGNIPRVSYTPVDGINLGPGIEVIPRAEYSFGRLVADIEDSGDIIGRMIIGTPEGQGVSVGPTNSPVSSLTLDEGHSYGRRDVYSRTFDPSSRGFSLYRESSAITLDENILGPTHIESIGAIRESPGVGWQNNNRMLLSFAAGDTVGEATRWFASYTFINLGDPVAHVDPKAPGTELEGVDRTIGTQIVGSGNRRIHSYKHKDMNDDGLEDIIVIYDDGFLELRLNLGGEFRRKEMIAYLPEILGRGVDFGDFTGDRYADILSLDHSGSFILVDNSKRKLQEQVISLDTGGAVPSKISQYKVFDMDADTRDDIVYLTEAGELGILYGTVSPSEFTQNILDQTLGVSLSPDPERAGGAIRASSTPTTALTSSLTGGTDAPDEMILNGEVFYTRRVSSATSTSPIVVSPSQIDSVFDTTFIDSNSSPPSTGELYVRSEYALAYGIEVEKRFKNISASTLHAGDRIQVEITVKNTGTTPLKNIRYLDGVPKIFETPEDSKYRLTLGGLSTEYPLAPLSAEDYDLEFQGIDIPSGSTLMISYELIALPVTYGKMLVDTLEGGMVGDDIYGDVGFETSNTCGADMLLWSSTAVRTYQKGTRTFGDAELPPSLVSKLKDSDGDGIPDGMESMSTADLQKEYKTMGGHNGIGSKPMVSMNINPSGGIASIGLSPQAEAEVESVVKNLADGLSCGFGGGGCMSLPINWAPLAPGNAISVLGSPVGRSPAVNQGIPIFSALTRMDIGVSPYCVTIPFIWPVTPLSLNASLPCSSTNVATAWAEAITQLPTAFVGQSTASTTLGAGGVLGASSSSNFLRIFVTPTLTMGMGTAICMGGPATTNKNPLYPLISKGNCIVLTKSLPVCKGDGTAEDGDVSAVSGLGSMTDAWNGNSCTMKAETLTQAENTKMTTDILDYLKSPDTTRLNAIYSNMSRRGARGGNLGGPVVRIGGGGAAAAAATLDIELDMAKPLTSYNIIKAKNKRISGFPEFIMDWIARQTDEFTNKFMTLPNIIILPPRSFGQNAVVDGSYEDFLAKFSEKSIKDGYAKLQNQIGKAGNVNAAAGFNKKTTGKTGASSSYNNWLDSQVSKNASTINSVAGGANQIRAVYQFIGQLPFLRIEQANVNINIPWILPQELDKYARSLEQYQKEIKNMENAWCKGKTAKECADMKTSVGVGGLSSGIDQNLKRIEEWRRLPEKIQKYITWKQRYITQILCNVDALEQMLGGWYRDNGMRFKKWAEFYVLMKTIIQTWQPILDIWKVKDQTCAVCQNQRWDLKQWKFKMLSAVIPSFPILQFPRWPDIVLDLSDIRFGILIRVPDFRFNVNPIRLPELPRLGLPGMPSASLSLPGLPTIPAPPNLPDLPDLPSLPRINLPNLPPPPKLPKIFGAVSVALNIFKLYIKIQCYMEKTVLVPEDYAGATIAQRTDRQGTFPFDFLSIQFPQIAIPGIREIRISTHVNFELKSDFIVEFAKNAVKPINRLNADFATSPKKLGPDVNISTPSNINLKPGGSLDLPKEELFAYKEAMMQSLEDIALTGTESLDIDAYLPYLRKELVLAGIDPSTFDRSLALARTESDALTKDMIENSQKGFSLIRKYLKTQEAKTKEQEKMLDNMMNPPSILSDSRLPLGAYINDKEDISDTALSRYTEWQAKNIPTLRQDDLVDKSFSRQVASLQGQVSRLLAAAAPAAAGSQTTAGYAPKYEGVYILSPVSKTQTRLFDYIDLVQDDTEVDVIDIDQDGDDDYIYLLGESLYIKYSSANTPPRSTDLDMTIASLDLSLFPRAPDFFHELVSSPGQMEVTFSSSDPSERNFRLEFFDKYMEWDNIKVLGIDDLDTPRVTIDLTVAHSGSTISGISETPVLRSLESVASPTTGFLLEGMKVSLLSTGQEFSLSAGRAIYTGNNSSTLAYTTQDDPLEQRITLDRFTRYTFDRSIEGVVTNGKLYVLTPSGSEQLEYTPDMIGMPLLPGTRIIHPAGSVSIYDPTRATSSVILAAAEYRHIDLGKLSPDYNVSLSFPNGFYSARLRSLTDDRMIRAGITLIAPQASLDRSPPVVDIPGIVRVPVYKTSSILLSDVITEMSDFSLMIDPDTSVDTDGNGVFEDDFILTGGGVDITLTDITFGPYDTLGTRNMMVQVIDAYGNTSLEPLEVEVYAPVPQIQSISATGSLFGKLDEEIDAEPIHLYRVREGEGIRIVSPLASPTGTDGDFLLNDLFQGGGVTLALSGQSFALSEKTGLPLTAGSLSMSFSPASATEPMKITTSDSSNTPLFTTEIIPPLSIKTLVNGAPTSSGAFLLINPTPSVSIVPATLSDPSIPGGYYITRLDTTPLIAIDIRGQIYSLDSSITFVPREEDGYLTLSIQDGPTRLLDLQYRLDFFFTSR